MDLETLANLLCDDLQVWVDIVDDRGYIVDRVLVRGVNKDHRLSGEALKLFPELTSHSMLAHFREIRRERAGEQLLE